LLCITGQIPPEGPLSILHEDSGWLKKEGGGDWREGFRSRICERVYANVCATWKSLHKKSAPRLVPPGFIQVW